MTSAYGPWLRRTLVLSLGEQLNEAVDDIVIAGFGELA
jgi:hypothetical protein